LALSAAKQEGTCDMPNLNVTYADMQSAASQLKAGEQQIEGDLARLKQLIDNLVASGYVTDSSSKQFEASYAEFNTGATRLIQGLTGMGQYLDSAANTFQEADAQLAASLK
jgi:WXG100 family type VII secretion target